MSNKADYIFGIILKVLSSQSLKWFPNWHACKLVIPIA